MREGKPERPDAVALYVPGAGPEERTLRLRIHRARDFACARAGRSSHPYARAVYQLIEDIASDLVFTRSNEGKLFGTINVLALLIRAANAFEELEPAGE